MDDRWRDNPGVWQAYCEAPTKTDRRARLAEVPEEFRPDVERHLETWHALRKGRDGVT